MFGNPFAAGYGAKSAKTMAMGGRRTGGNRRRVGWYKANRASQEDSFAPPFLPFPPLPPPLNFPPALFTPPPGYLLSYFARPGIVFSCLLILALLFRVTLTTNLCFLSPREKPSRLPSRPPLPLSFSLLRSFGRVKFCGFKLPVRATLSISDIRRARVKLAFSCIS